MYLQDSLVCPSLLFYVNLFIYKYIYIIYICSGDHPPEPGLKNFSQNYSPPKVSVTQNIVFKKKKSKEASPFKISLHINHPLTKIPVHPLASAVPQHLQTLSTPTCQFLQKLVLCLTKTWKKQFHFRDKSVDTECPSYCIPCI